MTQSKFKVLVAVFLIIIAASVRLIIPIPNVSPIASMALMGGAFFQNSIIALLIPILTLFASDAIIGFYNPLLMFGVYAAFVFMVFIGKNLIKQITIKNVILASILASLSFYIITNFFVWLEGLLYPRTFQGLVLSYWNAIPFLFYELFGTLFFNVLFFGSYYLSFRFHNYLRKI